MLAVRIENRQLKIVEMRKPRPGRGQALLRLRLAGICNTDLELLRGYYGFSGVPGHEFVADVVAASDAKLVGKRVVGEINLACGRCTFCSQGLGRHCARRTVLGIVRHPGAFAEYLTLPEENLRVLPHSISDEEAVFTEPLAAACEILDQVRFQKGATVAVLGDGKLGLLIAQVLHLAGLKVELFGRSRPKLSIVAPMGIATHILSRDHPRLPTGVYPYVVEASGTVAGFEAAAKTVSPRGVIVMKSTIAEAVPVDFAPLIVNEITLIGSRCGRFDVALKLLKRRELRLEPMISRRMGLHEAVEAFSVAAQRGILKVLLKPEA